MDEIPLIQQYMHLRSEFMGYLYAMTRDAELAEEIYQNAAVVVMEKAEHPRRTFPEMIQRLASLIFLTAGLTSPSWPARSSGTRTTFFT